MAWESANDRDICAGNQTTPNFALLNIALGSTLVAPNPGTNVVLGKTTYNHVAAPNSINSISQTVSEVGVFRMTATPPVVTPQVQSYFGYTISYYGGEFAKGLLYLVAGNNHDGVDRTDRVGTLMSNWTSGEANIDSQSRFARLFERYPGLIAPEETFKLLRFGLQVVDGESHSVSFMADTDLNPGIKNGCTKGVN